MVSVLILLPLLVIVGVNTLVAAVMTRLFRVRLDTDWGAAVFVALFVPVALTVLTILMGSIAGPSLGSRGAVVGLLIVLPLALGVTVDVFWMPAPEAVERPATTDD
jgi:hypothetical protein